MLSKNNKKLQAQKPKQQRFAIKKFTVGVASVLVGTTFAMYSGAGNVSADETATENTSSEVVENKSDDVNNKEVVLSNAATNAEVDSTSTANTDATALMLLRMKQKLRQPQMLPKMKRQRFNLKKA